MQSIRNVSIWLDGTAAPQYFGAQQRAYLQASRGRTDAPSWAARAHDLFTRPATAVLGHMVWTQAAAYVDLSPASQPRGFRAHTVDAISAVGCLLGAAGGAVLRVMAVALATAFIGAPWALLDACFSSVHHAKDMLCARGQQLGSTLAQTLFFQETEEKPDGSEASWIRYVDKMAKPRTWGTNVEIRAAAQIWQKDFRYIKMEIGSDGVEKLINSKVHDITGEFGPDNEKLYLIMYSYLGRTYHYDPLVRHDIDLDLVQWDLGQVDRHRERATSYGACLFSSIGILVGEDETEVRRRIVSWLRTNGMTFTTEANGLTPVLEASFS